MPLSVLSPILFLEIRDLKNVEKHDSHLESQDLFKSGYKDGVQNDVTFSLVFGPAALKSSGSLLEMHQLRPHFLPDPLHQSLQCHRMPWSFVSMSKSRKY